jgi:coenzyme PQQ precursor peptide PqqA
MARHSTCSLEVDAMVKETWETPEFEVVETSFEATMYVYTR